MRLSKLQKLNPSAIGKCAMVFVPPLAIGKWRNGGVLLGPLRHGQCRWDSLCAIYKGSEHSSWLLPVKMKDGNQKSLFRNWHLIPNFFIMHLSILIRCKTEGAFGLICALLRNRQLGALPINVRDGAVTLKGFHRMGDGRICSKNLRASLFNDDLSNEPYFGLIHRKPSAHT